MKRAITARLGRTTHGTPLAVVDGFPGGLAEMTPAELRALAAVLLRIADDSEAPMARGLGYLRTIYITSEECP